MRGKPNIKDIAKATGLSTAAVSYALTGRGRVSAETQEIVRKVAEEMGFIRDSAAVRLRTGQSRLLGAVLHDTSNPFFAELLSDFEARAYEAGYLTIVANTHDESARQAALIDALLSQGVAGLLISPANCTTPEDFAVLRTRATPYVIAVRDVEDLQADYVGADDRRAGYLAASHLFEAGLERFAVVGGLDHTRTWQDRLDGIKAAVAERGAELDEALVFRCAPTRENGTEIVNRIIRDFPECHAAICFNDYIALGAYAALHGSGRRVGEDFSIIGIDNVPLGQSLLPPLTTVELYPRGIGGRAARLLLDRMQDGRGEPDHSLIEPRLVARQSVAGAPKSRGA
ncbi:MAG: LacI family DNA-binding transcriptional regulator [Alphaproteobacteria bacterium]|nr:LacI family DNA-binding transcriptional regulator [Alphaproteobacteria bacterium]